MKGLVLAAGKGTRLYPMTKPVCKPLLPVYDKPLIYYPITTLIQAGISDILVIVPPNETNTFAALLEDGKKFGINISYMEQPTAHGIADALLLGQGFIGYDQVCLALGDNIFYGANLSQFLKKAASQKKGATDFAYYVKQPQNFGVVEFDHTGKAISIEEKPTHPKSNYIIPGLYFYDQQAIEIAQKLKPSNRGELEITDVNMEYLRRGQLQVIPLEKDIVRIDAGTVENLLRAGQRIKEIQDSTGRYVGCIEETALSEGLLTPEQVHQIGKELDMTLYGKYLQCL